MPSGSLKSVSNLSKKHKQMLYLFLAFIAGYLLAKYMNNYEGLDNENNKDIDHCTKNASGICNSLKLYPGMCNCSGLYSNMCQNDQ